MARKKPTPVKSAQKENSGRKSGRETRKASTRGTTESNRSFKRKLRFHSQSDEKRSSSKKKTKTKGKASDDYLPPELRRAGLLAQQSVSKGKCFGPFRGQICKSGKKSDDNYSLVCKIKGVDDNTYSFFVHDEDKEKCMWLQRMQSASSKTTQNMVAYKSAVGVCYEATCDIGPGEELLVLYNDTYGGKKYPAYVESIPVQFVPHSGKGQLTVLPLDDKEEPLLGEDNKNGEDSEKENDSDDMSTIDGQEEEKDNDGDDDDDNEDVNNDDGDDNDDDNDGDDSDGGDDDDGDDNYDEDSDEDYTGHGSPSKKRKITSPKKKTKMVTKVIPSVKEIKHTSVEDGTEVAKYQCSYCATEFPSHDAAEEHVSSKECTSLEFTCDTGCGQTFDSKVSKMRHKCGGSPVCSICDMEMSSYKELLRHMKEKRNDEEHKPRCRNCDLTFETRKEKRIHVREKHSSPDENFECPVCQKVYTNKSYLKDHIQTHTDDAFKCPHCQKHFSSKSNLRKHIHKHSPGYSPAKDKRRYEPRERKHECSECQKKFDTPHSLEIHVRSHTGERPYECELCHWKFSQKPHLKRHMNTVHRSDDQEKSERVLPPAEMPRTCEQCNKVYANARVLRVHIQSVHEKERPHKCAYCESTFTQRGHLWRHKHTVHPDCEEVQKKILAGGYKCTVKDCKSAFPCKSDLSNHLFTVHQTQWPFQCEHCGATFANKSNLQKHIRRRHTSAEGKEKPFACDTCNKEFDSHYKLTQHIRTHTGEKEFKCELCDQTFVQKSGLNKHIRCRRCPKIEGSPIRQMSSKKYECEVCLRVFPGPSDLKAHARSHTGEKPFECNECHKMFSQTGNLTKHIKYVHNKEKRPKDKPREKKFFCSLCGKAFSCPSSLAMHCRTHSGNKPFKCETCKAGFAQLGNLKKHLKRWHDRAVADKLRRKRLKERLARDQNEKEARVESESDGVSETRNENEATSPKDSGEQEDNSVEHESEAEGGENNQEDEEEIMRREETAIASILTSITSDQNFATNPRGFTPLNTPSPGFFFSPLNSALSSVGSSVTRASIIMTSMSPISSTVTVPAAMSQMQQNIESAASPHTQLVPPVFVPPQLGSFMASSTPPSVISQITSSNTRTPITTASSTSSISSSSTILPHVHTILNPQMNPQNYVPHTTMNHVQTTELPMYPFSPSSLFQH